MEGCGPYGPLAAGHSGRLPGLSGSGEERHPSSANHQPGAVRDGVEVLALELHVAPSTEAKGTTLKRGNY